MEFQNNAKVKRSNTYTAKSHSRIIVKPIRRLTPQPGPYLDNLLRDEPLESYEDFRNHLQYCTKKLFKPSGFSNMPADMVSGNLDMMDIDETKEEIKTEVIPAPELHETILESRKELVPRNLFSMFRNKRKPNMFEQMFQLNLNGGVGEAEQGKCKCKVEEIVEQARKQMGIGNSVKSKIDLRNRKCLRC